MGGGDIKLMAARGWCLGLQKGIVAIIMGLTALLVFHAIRLCLSKVAREGCAEGIIPRALSFSRLPCAYFLIKEEHPMSFL
jgi:leader peptidase (prepilin peptidase)/N-methyltransferase